MLKERRLAANRVGSVFLKTDAAADDAAMLAATCMATMLKARAEARLPVGTGAHALQLVSEAAADLVRARQKLVDAHVALMDVRNGIGLREFHAYGDVVPCPSATLEDRVVGTPRLAAVA